jgi:hypothetical protein
MKVLVPGHRYALHNLITGGTTILQFYQDPRLHDGEAAAGPSCQEVIRALIDRVQVLDEEKPWNGNAQIVSHLRQALAGFEARAILRKAERGEPIETFEVAPDGHIALGDRDM